jgi:hypothetical protein
MLCRNFTQVKPVFNKLLLVSCALYLSGAHWAILQVTAWTGMLVARTQSAGVVEAVVTTFDGDHPCRMCSAISSAQEEERESRTEFPALKAMEEVKLVMIEVAAVPDCPSSEVTPWLESVDRAVCRTDAPPTPPPRTV